jgi:asparagine synthase (glutamine-hydrolysing)
MCGICGVIQIEGELRTVVPPEVLDSMTDSMIHRGPNDRGTYQEPGIALGVRRLSIVDVEGGHQPFLSEDGAVVAIQNGELYNHEEVHAELTRNGHHLRSRCDTEILPHLYEDVGERVPERVRGKFGLAVWDGRRRRALIARDRLGVKPLYYARCGDVLVFASELKSLLASGLVDGALDYDAIDAYLTFGFFAGPQTPLAGVSKLPPGHRLIVGDGHVRVEEYWRYPLPAPRTGMSADEHAEGLLAELEEAVRLRLMSDVPLGAMLSGGLDSSLIVALMARHTSGPVQTFSVGFVEDDLNELADAREVAQRFGADHHELELSRADADLDLPQLAWFLDEPLADLSSIGFLALSELASRHVTVALSGQGADELLGGYPKHQAASVAAMGARVPAFLWRAGIAAGAHGPARIRRASRTLSAPNSVERLIAMSSRMDEDLRRSLFRGPLEGSDGSAARRVVADRLGDLADAPLPATLYIDAKLALVDDMLHYFDRASMAHSLEVRVPFLDHSVVEYCAGIPAELKVRRLTTKYLLKRASRGILPDRIIDKRKIGFFAASVDGWFRDQASGAIAEYLLAPRPHYADILDPQVVRNLVRRHAEAPDGADARLLLAILMLEVWLSTFLPRALGQTSASPIAVPIRRSASQAEASGNSTAVSGASVS